MKKLSGILLMSLSLGFISNNLFAQQGDSTKDKEAIRQLVTNYENAWNRHDPKGLAANYDENATWVNWFGAYYVGRKDIQDHYEAVHTTYFKNSTYYNQLHWFRNNYSTNR